MALATVKAVYKAANSGRLLLLLIIGSWLIAAAIFALIEQVAFFDAMYWSMTTMSTVGYGDLSPATLAGKCFTMFFMAWSIFFVVPCAVAHVIDKVRIDTDKQTHEEQEWEYAGIEHIAKAVGVELPPQPKDY